MPRPLLLVPLLLLTGCAGLRPDGQAPSTAPITGGEARATLAEVDQQCFAFADRYAAGIASAIERMVAEEPDPLRRRDLRRLRVEAVGGVYDVATGADPFAKLLDLVLVTTLQSRVWIDELEGERQFGPRGALLADAIRRQRIEIWRIAGDALTPEQLQELDGLITAWRRANPAVRAVSFVRFDEAGAARGRALAAAVESGDGLLAPVDRAAGIADRTRALGERMFWLGKRLPFLLQWQMELSVDELLLRPDLAGLAATVNGMPALIERERTALLAELDRAGGEARGLMAEARRTIDTAAPLLADVRAATASLDQTVAGVNRLAPLFVPVPDAAGTATGAAGKPFDIQVYAAALTEARHTLEELNRLVGSSAVPNHIRDLNQTAAERVEQASERAAAMLRLAFLYTAALVVLLLAAAMAYRWWSARLRRQEPR